VAAGSRSFNASSQYSRRSFTDSEIFSEDIESSEDNKKSKAKINAQENAKVVK